MDDYVGVELTEIDGSYRLHITDTRDHESFHPSLAVAALAIIVYFADRYDD